VYDSGVRGFGFGTAVAITAIIARLGWATDSDGLFGPMMTLGLLAGLFFGTPVALHLGYWWGNIFAKLTDVEHDHKVEVGEPPYLT
jgi:Na+/glutamate symporter